jgi:hypothetical protein
MIRTLFFAATALATFGAPALADTITLGGSYNAGIYMIENGVATPEGGGNVTVSTAVIGGNEVDLQQLYCVDLFDNVSPSTTYGSIFTNDGTVNGNAVADAGEIAWLILNIAPVATTAVQQSALQALLWTFESGTVINGNVQTVAFDTKDNSAAVVAAYNSYVAALGTNTAPVSDVYWVTPQSGAGVVNQGLVALTGGQLSTYDGSLPEPSTYAVFAIGLLGLAALRRTEGLLFKKEHTA